MNDEHVKPEGEPAPLEKVTEPSSEGSDPQAAEPAGDELQQLREQLEAAQAESRANYDRFLRERADVENFRRRTQRELAESLRFATEPLIRELLPVVDNLERALEHADGDGQSVTDGVRLVLKSLLDLLDRHGVKRIQAVGEPFDPARHEAMAQVPSDEHEPNRVVEQHHSGYTLHDRLLRPALVTVSRRKTDSAVETEQDRD